MSAATSNAIFHPNLPLSVIVESAHNPRKRFDAAKLAELAENIAERGIDVPVTVREVETPSGSRFELAAGHRRCRAARIAGLTEVPALIRTLSDREFLEVLHIDNLQREGLDPLDEALGYERLLAEGGYDTSTLATKIGRSLTYVLSLVRLLSLGGAAREALARGYLPLSHAVELAKLPERVQRDVLEDEFSLNATALEAAATGTLEEQAGPETDVDEDASDDDGERIMAKRPEDPFAYNEWDIPTVPPLAQLRHTLKTRVYRRLNSVPWALTDAELVPNAGACSSCSKRSGAEPLLFSELDAGTDACLDLTCFSAKHEAFVQIQSAVQPAEPEVNDPDAEEERVERMGAQQAERQKLDQQRIKENEKAQRARDAVVSAIVSNSTNCSQWLAALVVAFAQDVGYAILFAVVERLCMPIKDSDTPSVSELVEAISTWAESASSEDLVKALIILALGHELTIQSYGPNVAPRIDMFAYVAKIDASVVAMAAAKEKPAKSSTPKKDKPARASRRTAGVQ